MAVVLAGAGFGVYTFSGSASANPSVTQTVLASSPNPSVTGQSVTFTATVSEVPPGPVPTGSVTFTIPGAPNVCAGATDTEPLVAGVAQCTTTALSASEDVSVVVTSNYLGDPNNDPSSSNSVTQSVGLSDSSVSLTSTAVTSPVTQGGCVLNITVNVTCPSLSGVTPGATVTDTEGAIQGGTTVVTLDKHAMPNTMVLSLPATGSPTESLTFQDNPHDLYPSGHAARYTATVTAVSPGTGTPTGGVVFTITPTGGGPAIACSNGTIITVSRTGTATCVVAAGQLVASGAPYTVMAAYTGSLNYSSSQQSASQGIDPLSSKTYVAGNPMPPVHGTPVHFTASVVPSLQGVVPTGTVTFTFTSQPITQSGCTLTTVSSVGRVTGCSLADVQVGDVVTDLTTPGDITGGTTVLATSPAVDLSTTPTSATDQQIKFTPASSPAITCDGGSNAIVLTPSGATCSLTGGLPQPGSPFDVVAMYSGDANDGPSSSHALFVKVR